jgi:hypothetical protein
MSKKETVVEIICLLLFMLFLYTALSKALDIERFRSSMRDSPVLKTFSGWLPYLVVAAEMTTAALLIWPRWRQTALYMSFGLMFVFTSYIVFILWSSKRLPCSCGGVIQKMSWNQHLIFNLIFTGLCLMAILLSDKRLKPNYLLQQ